MISWHRQNSNTESLTDGMHITVFFVVVHGKLFFMNRFSIRQIQILACLMEYRKPLSSTQLAWLLCTSYKTVQNDLMEVMRLSSELGITISGNSAGYQIVMNENAERLYQKIQYEFSCWESVDADTMRGYEMAAHLLYYGPASPEHLCACLYVSMPLFYRAKKQMEILLEQYHLQTVNGRREGLRIYGNPVRRMYLFALCMDRLKDECHDPFLKQLLEETGLPVFEASLVVYAQKHDDLPFSNDRSTVLAYAANHASYEGFQLSQPMEEKLRQWLLQLCSLWHLHLRCDETFIRHLSAMIAWLIENEKEGVIIHDVPVSTIRENSPVSWFCSRRLKVLLQDTVMMDDAMTGLTACLFQKAFSKENRVRMKKRIALISAERKEYISIFEERILQQYGSYIEEVKAVPLQQWEDCKEQFDLAFTSYPLSFFRDTDHVIFNPLVLSESSLSCVYSHIIERNRFQEKLERLYMDGCLVHTDNSLVREMMEKCEEVIPYRYGTGCMVLRKETDTTKIIMYVMDDPIIWQGVQYHTICAVQIGKNDSLHLIGRPLRMILQDTGFVLQLGRIQSDEQLTTAMKEALSRLHEAVY